MTTPKVLAAVGKEPEIKAQPARTTMKVDAFGRNTPAWLDPVEGRPEGPLSIVLAVASRKHTAYLTREEALALADQLMNAVDRYDREIAAAPVK